MTVKNDLNLVNNNKKQSAKKTFCSSISCKIFAAICFILIGAGGTLLAQNITNDSSLKKKSQNSELFVNFDDIDHDISKSMLQMEKDMNDMMEIHQKHMREIFSHFDKINKASFNEEKAQSMQKSSSYSYQTNKVNKSQNSTAISSHQDDQNYIYQLNFYGYKKDEIDTKIKDGILTFSAASKNEKDKENYSQSSFSYSFSLPDYNSKKAPEIIKSDDKIIVKIAKK